MRYQYVGKRLPNGPEILPAQCKKEEDCADRETENDATTIHAGRMALSGAALF